MEDCEINGKVRKQIEYYLSDENLKNDKFFHNEIAANPEGWVSINTFQKCNKVSKLALKNEQIAEAVKPSLQLEVNEEGNAIRRKNNKRTPQLREKTLIVVLKPEEVEKLVPEPEERADLQVFLAKVFGFKLEGKSFFKPVELKKKLSKVIDARIPYIKLGKKSGQIVLDGAGKDFTSIIEKIESPVKIDKSELIFEPMDEDESIRWMKDNQGQLELGLKTAYSMKVFKAKKDRVFQVDIEAGPFTLGEREFKNITDLKNFLKILVNRTKNGDELPAADQQIIFDLLGYHSNPEKRENMKAVTVDINENFHGTRCFYVVKEDGSRTDFSFHKCLEAISAKFSKKNN